MNEVARSEPATLGPELCDRLLYYAWRAPSPHNAQGWRVEVDGRNFRVSRDPSRQVLREVDPQGRESDLACGATEDADGEPRLGMLETIREYALERLEQDDDLDGARRRRAEYYAAVAERALAQSTALLS